MDVVNTPAGQTHNLTHQAAQVTKLVMEVGLDPAFVPWNDAAASWCKLKQSHHNLLLVQSLAADSIPTSTRISR